MSKNNDYWNKARPGKVAIALLNFGGPRHAGEVEGFLHEILRDPNTIQLPFPGWMQNILAKKIARRRAPETTAQYQVLGGGSPIVRATETIAQSISEALLKQTRQAQKGRKDHPDALPPVIIVHRYLKGWCDKAAQELVATGAEAIFAVPLYPHFSFATTGSSLEQLEASLRAAGFVGDLRALRSYPDKAGYLEAVTDRLQEGLKDSAAKPEKTVILCSAHGLPVAYVEKGDPYQQELYRTLSGLAPRFPEWKFLMSYQSRVGPAEWLKPYTDEILEELAAEGVKQVVFLPLSFVNDHIETLYEIGHTYFGLARHLGMTPYLIPAIESHPAFVSMLAEEIRHWQAGASGVPVKDLLPPNQSFARSGRWVWLFWLMSLFAVGWLALV